MMSTGYNYDEYRNNIVTIYNICHRYFRGGGVRWHHGAAENVCPATAADRQRKE